MPAFADWTVILPFIVRSKALIISMNKLVGPIRAEASKEPFVEVIEALGGLVGMLTVPKVKEP